jgi:hypothetical protein
MAFTSQSIAKARDYAERMSNRMAKIREHAEEAVGNGIQVTEVGGTAFAFGYANGRWGEDGEIKFLGVPVDLGVGFALTGVAMFGGLGKYGEHGVNIGSGALASYAYRAGHQLGADASSGDTANAAAARRGGSAPRPRMSAAPVSVGWDPSTHGHTYTVHEQG